MNNGMDLTGKESSTRRLIYFFVIAFAFSWILWLPQVLKFNGYPELPDIVGLPGMFAPFGPAVAAFFLVWRQDGIEGVKTHWQRGWRVRFRKIWLLPALFLGPGTALITAALLFILNGAYSWEYGVPPLMLVPVFLLIYFTNALPEEYGWRGFALDPLQKRTSALGASLILGLIWALWHLPLFFIEGTTQAAIPMHEFFLQTIVLSILYTWLYNNTHGSVFIAILFHAVSNLAAAAVPFWTLALGRWIDFALLAIVALLVIRSYGSKRLAR